MPFGLFLVFVVVIVLLAMPGGPMLVAAVNAKTDSLALALLALVVWWAILAGILRKLLS
jgi:hypothetical protein